MKSFSIHILFYFLHTLHTGYFNIPLYQDICSVNIPVFPVDKYIYIKVTFPVFEHAASCHMNTLLYLCFIVGTNTVFFYLSQA